MQPRRQQVAQMIGAEKVIWDAQVAVEELPPDPLLAQAGELLDKARNRVADYVDRFADLIDGEKAEQL